MAKEKKNIIIIGAGSKICREIFKNKNQFNITGFSRYSDAFCEIISKDHERRLLPTGPSLL